MSAYRLYLRESGWYAYFPNRTCGRGRDIRVSLRTKDRQLAMVRAEEKAREFDSVRMRKAAAVALAGLPLSAISMFMDRLRDGEQFCADLVYVLYNARAHCAKIGHSTKIRNRLSEVQTSSPDRLELLLLLPGGRPAEQALHNRFARLHRRGEWFDVTWEFIDWLEKERTNQAVLWEKLHRLRRPR
jgi:hypothetical protein